MNTAFLNRMIRYHGVAAAVLFLAACSSKQAAPPPPPPPKVTVQEVKLTNAVYYDEYPATVNALNQVNCGRR